MTNYTLPTEKTPNFVKQELAKFNLTDTILAQLKNQAFAVVVADHEDKQNADLAKDMRKQLLEKKKAIETKRVELKADALSYGRMVDKEAKRITSQLDEILNHLKEQREIVTKHKQRLEAEKRRKEAEERAKFQAEQAKLRQEQERLEQEKREFEAKKRREEELEKAKKEAAERAKKEAEHKARIEAEQKAKQEAEEKARQEQAALQAKLKEQQAPDKEKLLKFLHTLENIEYPELNTVAANNILHAVKSMMRTIIEMARGKAENL